MLPPEIIIILALGSVSLLLSIRYNVLDYFAYVTTVLLFILTFVALGIRAYAVSVVLFIATLIMFVIVLGYRKAKNH